MIIPRGFYYEVHHPELGNKAHFVIRYLPMRDAYATNTISSQCALMTNLYVHPKYRANGVGKEMLRYLKHWQDTTDTDVVFQVSPYRKNPHLDYWCLKNFYTEQGFPEIAGTRYHWRKAKQHRR